ncbi:hypothetical protein MPTK1_2g09660 [Marchantia polymorpha subsp. ruderalis]|uniref:Uncharacterized protein n=1 Tax=Marchantia polymorpha TaxID=3197 RepID=A0A2R6W476_MARPO|nr:hypothetical protein MARPO_0158s0036 [Marchantia polymorpha]BBN01707.1 hypothetical protein Mp_2g09660 [Marchantia polymorpha subsp. ruderalis]|eukprot:PTQ28659.1 hypothetical protein MARPO_0158s0036 [Marchantia polymorpha]
MPRRARPGSSSAPTTVASMGSWFSVRDARAACRITSPASIPGAKTSTNFRSMMSLFSVSVPASSLQRMSIPASSSMVVMRLVMASCAARRRAPMAIVTKSTVGMAIGMPPMSSTSRLSMPSW